MNDDRYMKEQWLRRQRYGISNLDPWIKTTIWTSRVLVGLFCLAIGYTMLTHKKFKQHPYRLYALDLIFLTSYILNIPGLIVDFLLYDELKAGLRYILPLMGKDANDEDVLSHYFVLIMYFGFSFQYLILHLFLMSNVILNTDIYRMMKNPFKPPRKRVSGYYTIMALFTLFMILGASFVYVQRYIYHEKWIELSYDDGADRQKETSSIYKSLELMVLIVLYPLELFLNFILIFKIILMLQRQGTSPRLMKAIKWRYLVFFLFLLPLYAISAF